MRSPDAIRSEAIAAIQAVTRSAIASIHDLVENPEELGAAETLPTINQLPSVADLDTIAQDVAAKEATTANEVAQVQETAIAEDEEKIVRAVPRLSPNDMIRAATGQATQTPPSGLVPTPNEIVSSELAAPPVSTPDETAQPEGETGDGGTVAAAENQAPALIGE